MLLWQRGGTEKKQKTALIPKGTKAACASNSVVPPKLQRIKCVPCRFRRVNAALRPTCVAGSSGVARNDPDRSTLQPWALSLDGGVCISDPIIAICHNFTFRKADIASLCVQLNYSIRKTFVNGFEQNLRHPDAVCTGYLAVLDGHGRVSCIPPISIFFIAHCITNRPISLYDHWVGFKVCCTVR